MDYREFRLSKIEELPDNVRLFTFVGEAPPYRPGNFFLIRLAGEDGKKIFRPFSSAAHPSEENFHFCIKKNTSSSLAAEGAPASSAPMKKNGAFTSLLWNLREGDSAEIAGPYGIFVLDEKDGERVFIGGGTGIAPLRSMLLQTLLEGKRATLFHSARTLQEMVYGDEMKRLAAEKQNFSYFPAVTREQMPEEWGGIRGRLTLEAIVQRLGSLSGKTFYLCGSKEMVESVAGGLMASGVPKERIKKEEWG